MKRKGKKKDEWNVAEMSEGKIRREGRMVEKEKWSIRFDIR